MQEYKTYVYVENGKSMCSLVTDKCEEELVAEIRRRTGVKEVLIDGYNFRPVANAEHFAAAGLYDQDVDKAVLREPAHFNPPFFKEK